MEQQREFLNIPYTDLEVLNLEAKKRRKESADVTKLESYYRDYLQKEKSIKAVTVTFSDLEGRLHMLDYDKKYILSSGDSLTFDGSSVRGFTSVHESDLYLRIDWSSFYYLPADVFGAGKVLVFAYIYGKDNLPHPSDFRSRLHELITSHFIPKGQTVSVAPEIEGILVKGLDAEINYDEIKGFELVSAGGYYHSLPQDALRLFIDKAAEVQRALGFENEKDHPEVAPSQFELNFKHNEVRIVADQILLYKLVCRQVAEMMGMTSTFLPKPVMGINGSGMHINLSVNTNGTNLFHEKSGATELSRTGSIFVDNVLAYGQEIALVLNPSVNSYRRLDPNFEAPNQIKVSAVDRSAMVRIPLAGESQARIEVRSVAPDANPYLVLYTLLKLGFEIDKSKKLKARKSTRTKELPGNMYDAIRIFKSSRLMKDIMGKETSRSYVRLKEWSAHRCPRELGKTVKRAEVIYHHEVTNQYLWGRF